MGWTQNLCEPNIFPIRGVNLAQSTGLGSGPCGLEPKKPTLKKKSPSKSPQDQKPHKSHVSQG